MKNSLFISLILLLVIYTCKTAVSDENLSQGLPGEINLFFYSKDFLKRFDLDSRNIVAEWTGTVAVNINNLENRPDGKCISKIYLGNDINFDYPTNDNFINIWGDRFDDIFSFTKNVNDEDSRLHAKLAFDSANRILLHGVSNGKTQTRYGFNIDYIMRDAAKDITFIKTQSISCSFFNENHDYFLLLKPKGVDKSADFFKYRLPIKRNKS